jgi:hypothetical protein
VTSRGRFAVSEQRRNYICGFVLLKAADGTAGTSVSIAWQAFRMLLKVSRFDQLNPVCRFLSILSVSVTLFISAYFPPTFSFFVSGPIPYFYLICFPLITIRCFFSFLKYELTRKEEAGSLRILHTERLRNCHSTK